MPKRSKPRAYTKADLDAVSDNPEWTKADFAKAKSLRDVLPNLDARIKRSRGRPKIEKPKEAVTLRLSPDTVKRFKAVGGKDWRSRMADALDRSKT